MQIMSPQDVRTRLHSLSLHAAPEYHQRELSTSTEVGELPVDWAVALEDERMVAETLASYPKQITREDLFVRVCFLLGSCRSDAWRRVRPEALIPAASLLIHPAGSKAA